MNRVILLCMICSVTLLFGCKKSANSTASPVSSKALSQYYQIEDIPLPEGLDPQVGGLDFLPNGNLAACFHRGEIMIYDPAAKTWNQFARGLQEPLGIAAISNEEILVMQRPELTRLLDENKDGTAEVYETVTDAFGLTGNYHEFAFGPALTQTGTALIALGTASNKAPAFSEVRGEWLPIGLDRSYFLKPKSEWKEFAKKAGRMYSRVPWRGWVLEVDLTSGTTRPWASGFRTPNGILRMNNGLTIATDNQGDWVGTNPVYVAEKDGFHGHIASLPWRSDWDGKDPLTIPVEELESFRIKPAVQIPYATMANSPTQPIELTDAYGPFSGNLLIGEMNHRRLLRVLLENVNKQWQGAVLPFLPDGAVTMGNNRLTIGPDGSLWIGKSMLTWPGSKGIQRLTPTSKVPPAIENISLTPTGFLVSFTKEMDKASIHKKMEARRYTYAYHATYGSSELEVLELTIQQRQLSKDKKILTFNVDKLEAGFIYDFKFPHLRTLDGEPLLSSDFAYTVNALRKSE